MTASLRLARVEHRVLGPGQPQAPTALMRRYLEDMLGCHGLAFQVTRFAEGNGNSFVDLASALLRGMAPLDGEVDLIVIAHAFADCDPSRSAACHVTQDCPGEPLAFAISDQGVVSPFTAVRIAQAYGGERALVIILDQSTTPYDEPALEGVRFDHAVGVLLTCAGPASVRAVRQYLDVARDQVRELLITELPPASTVILGAALDPETDLPQGEWTVRQAPRDQLCTGVWTELAAGLPDWAGQRVLAIDYDPALEYLCLLDIEVDP